MINTYFFEWLGELSAWHNDMHVDTIDIMVHQSKREKVSDFKQSNKVVISLFNICN